MAQSTSVGQRRMGFVCTLMALATAGPLCAQVRIHATYGFGRVVLADQLNPLTLEIENGTDATLEVEIGASLGPVGVSRDIVRRSVEVSAGAGRLVSMLIPPSGNVLPVLGFRFNRSVDLTVDFPHKETVKRQNISDLQVSYESRDQDLEFPSEAILVLGARAKQLMAALQRDAGSNLERVPTVGIRGTEIPLGTILERHAPDHWFGYRGQRAILWIDPDLDSLKDQAQLRALEEYVRMGGQLCLLSAKDPGALAAEALDRWLLSGVLPFSMTSYPASLGPEFRGLRVDHRGMASVPRAASPWTEGQAPQLADSLAFNPPHWSRRIGRGTVTVAGFDPLVYDLGNCDLLATALSSATGLSLEPGRETGNSRGNTRSTDSARLRDALQSRLLNDNVLRPPIWLFLIICLGYALVLGPVDYALLKKRKKLHWSPWTLMLYSTLFTAACVIGTYFVFAPNPQVNRIAVLDFVDGKDGTTGVFGTVYSGIYSPRGGSFTTAPAGFDAIAADLTFADGFGGFGGRGSGQRFERPGLQTLDIDLGANSFRGVATTVSGHPSKTLRASFNTPPGEGAVEAVLSITNGMDTEIMAVSLVWESRIVELRDIGAGETQTFKFEDLIKRSRPTGEIAMNDIGHFALGGTARIGARAKPREQTCRFFAALSLAGWSPNDDPYRRVFRCPDWDLTKALGKDRGVLIGTTSSLPFEGTAGDDMSGFTFVHVRCFLDIPSP